MAKTEKPYNQLMETYTLCGVTSLAEFTTAGRNGHAEN
jgi:hypothetical protein